MNQLLSRFANLQPRGDSGRQWMARCPAHDDAKNSLSIRLADSGKLLMKCHAGCSFAAIAAAMQCTAKDFNLGEDQPMEDRIAATYDYCDEQGRLLYQVVRFRPKEFRQRRAEPGGWAWGLGKTRRVLYRLSELMKFPERLVLVVEGEKDADRLASLGFLATTCAMGAGKWTRASTQYNESLRGRRVVILPDNDSPGREHARQVAAALAGIAAAVHVLELAGLPDKGDVSDWLDAGHTADELKRLISALVRSSAAKQAGATKESAAEKEFPAARPAGAVSDPPLADDRIQHIAQLARGLSQRALLSAIRAMLAELEVVAGTK
jgi:putative DNA primase/helicase